MMNECRESDSLIVSGKSSNKICDSKHMAEKMERRRLAKGNLVEQNKGRTLSRETLQSELNRIRQLAEKDRKEQFTSIWHHVYRTDRLREAYFSLKRRGAPGIDGQTWEEYGKDLETNLKRLSGRLRRGAYRAKPVRRAYIPKLDGRQRPIGVPVLEDKIVQRALADVLNAIYEVDFLGVSYGFRPGRDTHNALDAVTVALESKKVNWVLDVDIRGFFDAIGHEWMIRFIEHRIRDKRVVRHVRKWLKAGVMEDMHLHRPKEGTPQGGSVSPLLSNIYLHYVFDLWANKWRKKAYGDIIMVRYADDIVLGFQYEREAKKFLEELVCRFQRFNLDLNAEKTRLIEFGRFASQRRRERGKGKPETFNFLGFTHICGATRKGRFIVHRQTISGKMRAKLKELKQTLRRRMHWPVPKVGAWLKSVLVGHYRYYGVPNNWRMLSKFRWSILMLWYKTLLRRSHKRRLNWKRMYRLSKPWLPNPLIFHEYPSRRLRVTT
jgi:group II intron reverse transcriptase/maturase